VVWTLLVLTLVVGLLLLLGSQWCHLVTFRNPGSRMAAGVCWSRILGRDSHHGVWGAHPFV